jgi:hypothetical protein
MRTDGWTEGDRQTDMTKLIVAFRNFTKASKSLDLVGYRIKITGNVHEYLPTCKAFVLKMWVVFFVRYDLRLKK